MIHDTIQVVGDLDQLVTLATLASKMKMLPMTKFSFVFVMPAYLFLSLPQRWSAGLLSIHSWDRYTARHVFPLSSHV